MIAALKMIGGIWTVVSVLTVFGTFVWAALDERRDRKRRQSNLVILDDWRGQRRIANAVTRSTKGGGHVR